MEINNKFYKEKLRQLTRMKVILMVMRNNSGLVKSPRAHEALQKAGGVTVLWCLLGIMFDELRLPYFIWILVLLFLSVAFFVYRASSRADTWIEEIDNKLMEYKPVDIDAYRLLQNDIIFLGSTTHVDEIATPILFWLSNERQAINEILHPEIAKARIARESERQTVIEPRKEYELKFVKKIINEKKED